MPWYWPVNATEPGTLDQNCWATVEGAPRRVVPVSIAARPSLLETEIDFPWTVTAEKCTAIRARKSKRGNAYFEPAGANRKGWYHLACQ